MNDSSASKYKTHLTVFGVIVAIWGILGWLDIGNLAQGGWAEDGDNTVTQVLPGSPSEAAGLQVGDHIISTGGIPRTDAEAAARRGRPEAGETWEFVVERDGETVSVNITFGELVPERKLIAHAGTVVGFCFLGFALWAYLKAQNEATMALAMTGILLSLAFLGGYYFENYTLRMLTNAVTTIIIFLGVAALLNFLLVYPRRSDFLDKANARLMLYGPGLACGLYLAYLTLATPAATSGLNRFTTVFIGMVFAGYAVACIVSAYKSYSGASAAERDSQCLNLMLTGTLVALIPPLLTTVTAIVSPMTVLPGQNFYFLAFILIPITWSLAVLKGSGGAPAAPAAPQADDFGGGQG